MTDVRKPYRLGAVFLAISAILHLMSPLFAGFNGQAPVLFIVGVVYFAAAWGLMRTWRWLAYVVFVVLMIGSVAALLGVWAQAPVPGWIYAGIFIANWGAVLALFFALWRPKRPVIPTA
jgi:glycerol-3-phosphate acyltransferase PlsY